MTDPQPDLRGHEFEAFGVKYNQQKYTHLTHSKPSPPRYIIWAISLSAFNIISTRGGIVASADAALYLGELAIIRDKLAFTFLFLLASSTVAIVLLYRHLPLKPLTFYKKSST